jgi:hypothetical protein
VPDWFQCIIRTICDVPNEWPLTYALEDIFEIRQDILDRHLTREEVCTNFHEGELQIWTDGSYKDNVMGSAAIIKDLHGTTDYLSKPPPQDASPLKAELWAMNTGLKKCRDTANITIHTDSAEAKKALETIMNPNTTPRQIMKMNHSSVLLDMKEKTDKLIHPV